MTQANERHAGKQRSPLGRRSLTNWSGTRAVKRVPTYTSLTRIVSAVAAIQAHSLVAGVLGYQLTKRAIERVVNTPPPRRSP